MGRKHTSCGTVAALGFVVGGTALQWERTVSPLLVSICVTLPFSHFFVAATGTIIGTPVAVCSAPFVLSFGLFLVPVGLVSKVVVRCLGLDHQVPMPSDAPP